MNPSLRLGLIPVAAFLLFAIPAAIVVPTDYTRDPRPTPPDEGAHLGVIKHLAERHSLPVFTEPNVSYEAHQPPLYYLSALPAYLIAGGPEYRRILAVRFWSVLIAAAGIWEAWLLGRRVFRNSSLLSLAPALFLALWPGRTLILSAITNDGLAELCCLISFYLCVIILQEGLSTRRAAHLGLAWGLGLLAKSTATAMAPVVLLAIVMAARQSVRAASSREPSRLEAARTGRNSRLEAARTTAGDDEAEQQRGQKQALVSLLVIGGIVALLVGWWFVRNQVLYGDPMAAGAFNRIFKVDRATPEYFLRFMGGGMYYLMVVINTALSFWGVYGQANVWSPEWYYVLGFAIWALALAGLVRQRLSPLGAASSPDGSRQDAARTEMGSRQDAARTMDEPWLRQVWILCWLLLAVVIVLFLRFNAEFYQAQARYLFAANGPIALLTVAGLWSVDRRRYGLWVVGGCLAVMALMSAWSVFGYSALVVAHNPPPFFGSMP